MNKIELKKFLTMVKRGAELEAKMVSVFGGKLVEPSLLTSGERKEYKAIIKSVFGRLS